MFKTLQWEDWMGVALGAWMLVSPWALGYSTIDAATMNALVMGTILVCEEMLELGVHESSEEWIDLVAGAWLVVSPVALGFTSSAIATANAVAVGALTMMFAGWALSSLDRRILRWWHERAVR